MVKENTTILPNKEAIIHFQGKTLLTSQSYLDVKAYEHALAFTVAKMVDQDLLKMTRDAILSAMQNGTDFRDFKRTLMPYLNSQGWGNFTDDKTLLNRRLRTIYHTNKQTAYAAGRWQRIQQTKGFFPYLQYMPSLSAKQRDSHTRYYGLLRPVDDPIWQSIFPPNGFGCFLGDVQIQGDLQSAMVKWYEGVAIELTTQSGRSLAVTANHPILTARGWVRADSLTTSDNVLCYGLPIDAVNADGLSGQVHYNQTVPTAKNLFKAFFDQTFAFTGTTAFKFNSDVANGEIHIDVINDSLVCHIWADVLQGVKQVKLIRGDDGRFVAIGKSNSSSEFAITVDNFICSQNSSNITMTTIKAFCQSVLACVGCSVEMNNFSFQFVITRTTDRPSLSTLPFNTTSRLFDVLPASNTSTTHISQDDTILTELTSNAFTTDFGLFGYLVDTHSSLVFTDPIINIQQFSFSGHCYDFQSSESIVSANGIIAHNCKCWVKQITRKQAENIQFQQAKDVSNGKADRFELEMETVENPRTGEKMTTPKGVHFSFAHNHDRLTALLKLAEDKHGTAFGERLRESVGIKIINDFSKLLSPTDYFNQVTKGLMNTIVFNYFQNNPKIIEKAKNLGLNDFEIISIMRYTHSHGYIQQFLRNPIAYLRHDLTSTKLVTQQYKHMMSALVKLPNYVGQVTRVVSMYDGIANLKIGDLFSTPDFMSCTYGNQDVFPRQNKVRLILQLKTGKQIDMLSTKPYQKEVLVLPHTLFQVTDIQKGENICLISMKEL